jgi:hypothetical protein
MAGCGMVQSIVKSTLPYTTTLTIPASAEVGTPQSAISTATSFEQNFSISGKGGQYISEVSVISAKLESTTPAIYNLGNLSSVKIYVSKADGKDEILVAFRTDIADATGNTLILDTDNKRFLDQLVREKDIRIRMAYTLRKKTDVDVNVYLALGVNAYPAGRVN